MKLRAEKAEETRATERKTTRRPSGASRCAEQEGRPQRSSGGMATGRRSRRAATGRRSMAAGRRLAAGVAVLAALGAVAASCGGDDSSGSTSPVVIGYLSVAESDSDIYYKTVNMAAAHFNLAGGIDGSPVLIIPRDTAADPEIGTSVALEIFNNYEGSVGIVGPQTSIVTVAVAAAAATPNKRLIISPSATSPVISTLEDDDYVYRVAVSDELQGKVLADLAWEEGYRNVGVIYVNDPYGAGLSEQFETTFTSLGGEATLVAHEHVEKPSFKAELEQAKAGGAEVLLAIGHRKQTDVYLPEAVDGGYFDKFLFPDAAKSPDLLGLVGWDALEGSLGTAPGSPPGRPERQAFREAYTLFYGKDFPEGAFLAENYDAAALIGLAVAKAGSTADPEAIRDALREIAGPGGEVVGPGKDGIARALQLIAEGKEINYEGASGSVDFDQNGDVEEAIEIWEVADGEIRSTGRFMEP